jgi:hypothetical protein
MQTTSCPICLDSDSDFPSEQLCPETHDPVCQPCMTTYLSTKINDAFMGSCPTMQCPCLHSGKKSVILDFPKWSAHLRAAKDGSQLLTRYQSLANSLLSFLCGACHTLKTIALPSMSPAEAVGAAVEKLEPVVTGGCLPSSTCCVASGRLWKSSIEQCTRLAFPCCCT